MRRGRWYGADYRLGMSTQEIADKLNSDKIRRWSKQPWDVRSVGVLIMYERREPSRV